MDTIYIHTYIESCQNYLICKHKYIKKTKLAEQNYHIKLVQEANNKSKVLWSIIYFPTLWVKNNSSPFLSNSLSGETFNNYFINKIDDNIKTCHSNYSIYLNPFNNNVKIPILSGFNFNEVSVDKTYKKFYN